MDNWVNILDENILKANVNFAAVFVMNYECLKEFVIEQVRFFYSEHFYMDDDKLVCEESETYKKEVRALDKQIENASLKWFLKEEAITLEDYETYQLIRKRRNEIAHELLKYFNLGFNGEDVQLFGRLLDIYQKLDKWWLNEIEIPISADAIPIDYDREGVCGGQAIMLSIINDIVLGNDGEKYKELLNEIVMRCGGV